MLSLISFTGISLSWRGQGPSKKGHLKDLKDNGGSSIENILFHIGSCLKYSQFEEIFWKSVGQ